MTAVGQEVPMSDSVRMRWGSIDRLAVGIVLVLAFGRASVFDVLHSSIGIYYLLLGIVFVTVFLRGIEHLHFSPVISGLVGCAILSIVFNDIPSYFHPWQRLWGWIFILGICSNWLTNEYLRRFRSKLCHCFDVLLMIAVVVGFIGYPTGIFPHIHEGLMNGLFCQSMMLGPIAGITALLFLHRIFTSDSKKLRLWWSGCLLISILSVLLASSRGAFFGLLVSVLFYFLAFLKFQKTFLLIILLAFLAYLTFPFWQTYTEMMQNKFESGIERSGSIFDSRMKSWEIRGEEIKNHPWLGCGFSAASSNVFFSEDRDIAGVEPGSGWLFIFSSMGIPAGILFVIFMGWPFLRFYLHKRDRNTDGEMALRLAILTLFGGHICIEGYVISAGSPLCILFWLYSSQTYDLFVKSAGPVENMEQKPDSPDASEPLSEEKKRLIE